MNDQDKHRLEEALGYAFGEPGLLLLALTHPSAANGGKDNQRLEFLGDAVLELTVSDALYRDHPELQEGGLTRTRAALVREESLAHAAETIGLGVFLRLDAGEARGGGREKPSVLADAVEAILGAVYLDGGFDAAKKVCAKLLNNFAASEPPPDYKSALQEREQAEGRAIPEYRTIEEEGPAHARVFTVRVTLEGGRQGTGKGQTKKQAEQEAARGLLG